MQFKVRRVVTGHNDKGEAIITEDRELDTVRRFDEYFGVNIWCASGLPVRNDDPNDKGEVGRKGDRVLVRTSELNPGEMVVMHRSETLDYAVVLAGTVAMDLDSGETVTLNQGDFVVQRGTIHAWRNVGDVPVRFLFVLVDAQPVQAGGKTLGEDLSRFPAGYHVLPPAGDAS
jgi:quercetin dioxygenase-like cupin family protein